MNATKKPNPWVTLGYAGLKVLYTTGWMYWTIESINNENWVFVTVATFFVGLCISDIIRLLHQAADEAAESETI